jgi:hypothetical protein
MACAKCGVTETKTELTPDIIHYAKLCCTNGHFLKWLKYPTPELAHEKHVRLKKVDRFCRYCNKNNLTV